MSRGCLGLPSSVGDPIKVCGIFLWENDFVSNNLDELFITKFPNLSWSRPHLSPSLFPYGTLQIRWKGKRRKEPQRMEGKERRKKGGREGREGICPQKLYFIFSQLTAKSKSDFNITQARTIFYSISLALPNFVICLFLIFIPSTDVNTNCVLFTVPALEI